MWPFKRKYPELSAEMREFQGQIGTLIGQGEVLEAALLTGVCMLISKYALTGGNAQAVALEIIRRARLGYVKASAPLHRHPMLTDERLAEWAAALRTQYQLQSYAIVPRASDDAPDAFQLSSIREAYGHTQLLLEELLARRAVEGK